MEKESLFSSSSLQVLKASTIEKIGNRLDQTKYIITGDHKYLRDWRGLLEISSLTHDEEQKVKSSKNYTRSIILLWSKKPKTNVQSFLSALSALDRLDIVNDFESLILRDCEIAAEQGVLRNSLQSEFPESHQALTLQDLEALRTGKELHAYDAIVLFGESSTDRDFGNHVVERLEAGGLSIFVKERDLVVGTMEHEASMDIIRARVKKVIPILTPSFIYSKDNLFLTKYAQYLGVMDGKNKIIPIIYCKDILDNELIRNLPFTKLPYCPSRKFNNFWIKLFAVFDLKFKHDDELIKYNFPEPGENNEKTIEDESELKDKSQEIGPKTLDPPLELYLPSPPSDNIGSVKPKKTLVGFMKKKLKL